MFDPLESYVEWWEREYIGNDDPPEAERVVRVLSKIDAMKCKLAGAADDERQWLLDSIAGLEASIADFGF